MGDKIDMHPEVTDDEVQHAADMADGKDDGIAEMPETDLGMALWEYEHGKIDKLELLYIVVRDAFVRGDRHETAADVAKLIKVLGPDAVKAAHALAALAG